MPNWATPGLVVGVAVLIVGGLGYWRVDTTLTRLQDSQARTAEALDDASERLGDELAELRNRVSQLERVLVPVDSCDDVVDETLALIQSAIDQANEMSMADLAAEEEPAFVAELETEGAALEERAEELDCDEQQVIDRLDEIDVEEGSVGELILEQIRSEGLG